ncbi:MAG: stage 0 sporulation family protein [Ruminococcus sp.]|jgi:cell fate regulator YaaT (PSP1 superfamily)|nr:stage 0 sporulation family protein [Ruminococcus sp.]
MEVIGVRFREAGKTYYFSPNGLTADEGQHVIVDTVRGIECGEVVVANKEADVQAMGITLKNIVRIATDNDLKSIEANKQRAKYAAKICEEKIASHGLKMALVDVECAFDNSKILFYFTAESRVDFRELVKDLASVFKTRIELRQIGVRDEAKIIGGLGICGRQFCCKVFLGDFNPVSIKMAKEQGLSLNPMKISGTCGRLMCCLKYEQDVYDELLSITPKTGAYISVKSATVGNFNGTVEDVNLLTGKLKVRKEGEEATPPVIVHKDEVTIIKDGKIALSKEEMRSLRSLER